MGLRILTGEEGGDSNGQAVLFCSTSMRALPFMFEDEEEAEGFLEHVNEDPVDFRKLPYERQNELYETWIAKRRAA